MFNFLMCLLLGVFYLSLVGISFMSCSLSYCLFLLLGALSFSGFIYLSVGGSWYLLLFCLIYVGGVYVLLVYVSMFNPNFFIWFGAGWLMISFFLVFVMSLYSFVFFELIEIQECGHYLCLNDLSLNYGFFCLVLLIGFCLVSLVSGGKDSFFR